MSVLACTATLGLNLAVTEPLLLAEQPLLATPRIATNYGLVNGLAAVADGIDLHWERINRAIAGGVTHTYTLSALVDELPRTLAFVDVKLFIVSIASRTAGNWLTLAPGATHGWTALVPSGSVKIYNTFLYVVDKIDSLPVVSNTTDQIDIANPGGSSITYSIAVLGNSG